MNYILVLIAVLFESLSMSSGYTKTKHKLQDEYPSTGCDNNEYEFAFDATSTDNTYEEYLIHDNIQRKYFTHLPSTYDHASITGHSLILNLHGYSWTAYGQMTDSLMNEHSDEHNYIAVYPQATSYGSFDGRNATAWNNLGCSGSPTEDGPTCSQTHQTDMPSPYVMLHDSKKGTQYFNTHTEWGNCVMLDNSAPSFNTLLFLQQQIKHLPRPGIESGSPA